MFKRSTKLTALLVAAASVASTVPAMAATKLANKDGTIEKGVAYKDNKYLYQGYRSDDDDNGLYISTSGKDDKKLDDANEIVGKFGDKTVAASDGSDDYVVDLESGKISDEDTISDLEDTALTKLKNKLKNADARMGVQNIGIENGIQRAGDDENYNSATATEKKWEIVPIVDSDGTVHKNGFERVTGGRFEDSYYVYNAIEAQTLDYGDTNKNKKADVFGYTNDNGKYIDCSYDLNLYAYSAKTTGSSADGKMYKVEDVNDKVNTDDNSDSITVKDVKFVRYIGQDDKYLYSVIAVKLKGSYSVNTKTEIDENVWHYYVQKVSKEQGDKHDDAYLPKTTECYEIAPEKVKVEVDADKKATGNIFTTNDSEKDKIEKDKAIAMGNGDVATAYDAFMGEGDFAGKACEYAIVDGNIYVYFENETDKIKIVKIKLATSEKLDRYNNAVENNYHKKDKDANKISSHVALKTGDKDHKMVDVETVKVENGSPWAVDVNGTLWFIKEGSIFKCVKMGDWEEVYTCDRSLDCIDVYDENNLIAWDSDGDVYTTIDEGSATAKEEAEEIVGKEENTTTEPAVTAKTGWDQLADGTWNLYDATGAKVTGWANVGGVWYYMDPTTAVMKTGWVLDNGTWYYCNGSGAMQTGWLNDNGTWYYLKSNGAMATGWLQDTDGRWYYLNANGSMAANTTVDGYVLGANGAWIR